MFAGKHTGQWHLARHRRKWRDNIRMDLREFGDNMRNSIDSVQDRNY